MKKQRRNDGHATNNTRITRNTNALRQSPNTVIRDRTHTVTVSNMNIIWRRNAVHYT